jgi:hypothetical protein
VKDGLGQESLRRIGLFGSFRFDVNEANQKPTCYSAAQLIQQIQGQLPLYAMEQMVFSYHIDLADELF